MKKFILTLTIGIILFSIDCFANDGPFGFYMGMPYDEIKKISHTTQGDVFRVDDAPKNHSDFEMYGVKATPEHGVCFVKAVGNTIETNRYGTQLTSKYEEIKTALTKIYGPVSDEINLLLPGSIWNEPEDFMTGLRKNERALIAEWNKDLPHNITKIYLGASALSREKGYLSIEYHFTNKPECDRYINENKHSVF